MAQQRVFSFFQPGVIKASLVGGFAGLILIFFFVSGVEADPEWPRLWKLRPFVLTPLASAAGAACAYVLCRNGNRPPTVKFLRFVLGAILFLVSTWLGIVLGLDGTMWD